jgi:hypothetical protein
MANAREVSTGTWESFPPPHETRISGMSVPEESGPLGYILPPGKAQRKGNIVMVPETRETEDREIGGSSLNILIVPIERWEISSMKATK